MKKVIILIICFVIISCSSASKKYSIPEQDECAILSSIFTYKDTTEKYFVPIVTQRNPTVAIADKYLDSLDFNSYELEVNKYLKVGQEIQKIYKSILGKNHIKEKCNYNIINQNTITKLPNAKQPLYIYLSKPFVIDNYCLVQLNYVLWGSSSKSIFILKKQPSKWNVVFYRKYSIE